LPSRFYTKQERKFQSHSHSHKNLHRVSMVQHLASGTGFMDEKERTAHYNKEKKKAQLMRKSSFWQAKVQKEGKCYYCGVSLSLKDATLDHILPLARGGTTKKGNVAVACKSCNSEKRDNTPVEWLHL